MIDYCSRDMAPPDGGVSRNRETTYSRQMGGLTRYVKQISFLCPAKQVRRVLQIILGLGQSPGGAPQRPVALYGG